jgi:hypothetical protein
VHNSPICAAGAATATTKIAAQNGGSRATAATSDRHAARLAMESMSDPAEYALLANQ